MGLVRAWIGNGVGWSEEECSIVEQIGVERIGEEGSGGERGVVKQSGEESSGVERSEAPPLQS